MESTASLRQSIDVASVEITANRKLHLGWESLDRCLISLASGSKMPKRSGGTYHSAVHLDHALTESLTSSAELGRSRRDCVMYNDSVYTSR